jgi:hypothetical protein
MANICSRAPGASKSTPVYLKIENGRENLARFRNISRHSQLSQAFPQPYYQILKTLQNLNARIRILLVLFEPLCILCLDLRDDSESRSLWAIGSLLDKYSKKIQVLSVLLNDCSFSFGDPRCEQTRDLFRIFDFIPT